MTEERTTVTETPDGQTHTHTIVHSDAGERGGERGGGAGKWIFLLILVVLAIGGLMVFNQMSDAEVVKDTAIADAAGEVGDAAGQIGEAAQDVADEIAPE